MDRTKQIKLGATISYFSIFLNIILGIIYTPWVVNAIGQSQYGLYTLSTSLISIFLIDFGLGAATARFLSKYKAEGDQEKVNNFLGIVYKLYLIIDAIIFLVFLGVFLFIDKIYVSLTPQEMSDFKIAYAISAVFAIFNFPFIVQNGILTAYEEFVPLKLSSLIQKIVLVALTIGALLLGWGLFALVAAHAVAGLVIIFYKLIVIKKNTKIKPNFTYNQKSSYKEIFGFSAWTTISALSQRLIFNITPSILGIVANSVAISIFGIVTTIEGYTYTLVTAINGMFMPKITRIYLENKDKTEEEKAKCLKSLFFNVGKFQFALNSLIIVGFATIGKLFIKLWVGDSFDLAYYGILCIALPGLFYNSLQVANTTLIVKGEVKVLAVIDVIVGIINVALSFVLSMYFGVIGACISIFISYSVRAILLNIVVRKNLKFDIFGFAKSCYFRMSIPLILSVLFGIGLNYFMVDFGWWSFLLKGVIIVAFYFISLFIIGITKDEKSLIFKKIKAKLHK